MTSAHIRQSFLDFFHARGHSIVPSSSLLPDSPGLLFTNAGMNQFVPIFLNQRAPDVAGWAGARPALDTRAADTQKCIRAGGKHNDLEDVGFDTYHHTFFEMLGNWSFGDYFKRESLTWGWELLTKVWGIPPKRLFATVYSPDPARGDPAEFDLEAWEVWAGIFRAAGLDPELHIVHGGRKDNFWMMGDTGPCGPCSEIHFNLLPSDDEAQGRALVNAGSPRCIEIWNHVFIQFDARPDGSFHPLPARHVDTGMGFERVAGIAASTRAFSDFTSPVSNYAADVFAPLFAAVTHLSGKRYTGTVPGAREGVSEQERTDVAFRVLADHARTVCCAVADGILPGNEGRNYVIRRILRRGILYGRKDLGLGSGFFYELVSPVVESLGSIFPELRTQQETVRRVIRAEEDSFGRTLDRGLERFRRGVALGGATVPGRLAFELYDTYGFPLDMTQLLAAELGLTVDVTGFEKAMESQRERARAAQKREVLHVGEAALAGQATPFIGYHIARSQSFQAVITDVIEEGNHVFLVFDRTPFYAEMGGQVGDRGVALVEGVAVQIGDTVKDAAGRHLHRVSNLEGSDPSASPRGSLFLSRERLRAFRGKEAELGVNMEWRRPVQRHHTATHLLHYALRRVLGTHIRQAGSLVQPTGLRFDFTHFEAPTPEQLGEVEDIVNRRVLDNAVVRDFETEFEHRPKGTLAFFGEKYGRVVRVVDIGGYSRELCAGTHVETTGEVGFVRIVREGAIAAGTRRIEAVAGESARALAVQDAALIQRMAERLGVPLSQVGRRLEEVLARLAAFEREAKARAQAEESRLAAELTARAQSVDGLPWVVSAVDAASPEALRSLGAQVASRLGEGVVILGAAIHGKASLVAFATPAAQRAGHAAGKLMSEVCARLGGRGGGKPDFAMGGGKAPADLGADLASYLESKRGREAPSRS